MDGYLIAGDPYKCYQSGDYDDVNVILGTNSDGGALFARPLSVEDYQILLKDCFSARYGKTLFQLLPARDSLETYLQSRKLESLITFAWPIYTSANLQRKTGNGNMYMYYFDEFEPGSCRVSASKGMGSHMARKPCLPSGRPWRTAVLRNWRKRCRKP